MTSTNTKRLVAALLLCCAVPADAATASRDERLELEAELAQLKQDVDARQRERDLLYATPVEDLIDERKLTRDPERYLRIVEVLLHRLAYKASHSELHEALGKPYESREEGDVYFDFSGTWTQEYNAGKPSGSRRAGWRSLDLQLPPEKPVERADGPVTQGNLTRLEVRRARTTCTIQLEQNKSFGEMRERYARVLPLEDLVKALDRADPLIDEETFRQVVIERIPIGSTREQVHAWAGGNPADTNESELYCLPNGMYCLRYADGKLTQRTYARYWSFPE